MRHKNFRIIRYLVAAVNAIGLSSLAFADGRVSHSPGTIVSAAALGTDDQKFTDKDETTDSDTSSKKEVHRKPQSNPENPTE